MFLVSDIRALAKIDWLEWVIAGLLLLICYKFLVTLKDWFCSRYGIETKAMREKREDHKLLIENTQAIKDLAELHKNDNDISMKYDAEIGKALSDFMKEVRDDIKKIADNRVSDRSQSLAIQKELTDAQLALSNSIHEISEKIDNMKKDTDERFTLSEEKQNKRVQSDIKERIAQSYRRYSASGQITKMELEALEDLIITYEFYKGTNSFVHSVVQKEMYTWEIVE